MKIGMKIQEVERIEALIILMPSLMTTKILTGDILLLAFLLVLVLLPIQIHSVVQRRRGTLVSHLQKIS